MKKMLLFAALLALTSFSATAATAPATTPQSQAVIDSTCLASLDELAALEGLTAPEATNASSCPDRANIYYYSDASKTTQVGHCYHGCCEIWTCTGEITDYYNVWTFPCDFN